jgi:hypothetical protein
LHLPTRFADEEMKDNLPLIKQISDKFNLDSIVVHTDRITNWNILAESNLPIAIENMDHQKDSGKTVADIANILDKYDFKFVLDVNHCFVNDASLKLVDDFLDNFEDRLAEIHLSGFEILHDPLFKTNQKEFVEKIAHLDTPIIIESPLHNTEEARQELNYVKDLLEKNLALKKEN